MSVMTVNGKIDAVDLGITSPHEHVYIDMEVFFTEPLEIGAKNLAHKSVTIDTLGVLKRNPFALKDNVVMFDEKTQAEELLYFKKAGGRTVVDATSVGIGRDPVLLRDMAVLTGLNIVAGSGFYVEGAQSPQTREMSVEEMERQIIREIEKGIGHTDIRAGIIGEIGVSHIIYPFEQKSLTAACRAQKATGAPLMVHINPWSTSGLAAMKIIDSEQVEHAKVAICHIDVENRRDYIYQLLDSGVYIEFDNFGKEMFTDRWDCKPGSGRFVTDWERVLFVKELVDKGYEKQLLLSCDICLKSLLRSYGGWGYDHLLTHIVPMLNEVGVTPLQIERMLVENPARWLDC